MLFTKSIAKKRQTAKQRDFLARFARSGNVLASAKEVGISRGLVYYWREHSPAFVAEMNAAADDAFSGSVSIGGAEKLHGIADQNNKSKLTERGEP